MNTVIEKTATEEKTSRPRRWGRAVLAVAMPAVTVAAGVVALAPSAAHAAPAHGSAYVWAHAPSTAAYSLGAPYSKNSTGGTNSINRVGVGQYVVHLPGLGRDGGTVHVTAYGSSALSCQVAQWFPNGPADNLDVFVRCHNPAGQFTDSQFTMSFVNTTGAGGALAYGWASQPTAPFYTLTAAFQFNSGGGALTATRSGVGQYRVRVPNQPGGGGHVQATAYGFAAARCKVVGWSPSGNDQLVDVRCFNPNGTARDNMFTVTFARGTGILRTVPAAYAWADQPASAVYLPSLAYQFNSAGGTNTVRRTGLGSYRVETFGQPLEAGTVNVTSYGSGNQHCKVVAWTPGSGILVRCYTPGGAAADSQFTVSFVR